MRTIVSVSIVALCLVANGAMAGQEVAVKEAGIAFTLPDTWKTQHASMNRSRGKKNPSRPVMLGWSRAPLIDSKGRKVRPGINVLVSPTPSQGQIALASGTIMHGRGWPFRGFLTGKKDGLRLPRTLGYLTEFSPRRGLLFKAFVIHIINGDKFVELILSATKEVFPRVEGEFRSIIRSLHLTK
jgi:hypothetical protein